MLARLNSPEGAERRDRLLASFAEKILDVTRTQWVLRDVKIDNAVVDGKDQVRLIDTGGALKAGKPNPK